ncbi:valine--tRNA ligase [Chloroflexota bacterium]
MSQSHGEIPRVYDPKEVEGKWYRFWLERDYFSPSPDSSGKPFVIIMPPPNITGELHVGHALTATLEDTLIRWHRMNGEPTLWLPGVDHAGIAGQNAVEKLLIGEGLSRHDLGREGFLERMWQWTAKYRNLIVEQHSRLGASCDMGRERFTMDSGPSRAVRTTFVNLYRRGLIYRGQRIISWCPRCATALSDLEVEHQEVSSFLYHVRYPLEGDNGFITVATTRPETILGDTAVATSPGDKRYRGLVGRKAVLPAVGRVVPIISDEAVDPDFGSGAVKITPAHDPVDFDVSRRHDLPLVIIMNLDATMNENAGPYAGLDRFACRKHLLADLEREGLLTSTEPYTHSVGHCQRCGTMVEPMASEQWFVRMEALAPPAVQAVLDGRVVIYPERFTRVYFNWMENIRDWCISRQLWWGHRIPVWYCGGCGELTVSVEDPDRCEACGSADIVQDQDVLDTWFSSALWPHSTLGWPEDTDDLRRFYPTSVMETGYDILFFWVARMIIMGLENTGQVPFSSVYLHGLIRDEHGDKMSKSRGNVVDPMEAVERYGADALRFSLTAGSAPGSDMKLSRQRLEGGRNFANKLWNAARFVISEVARADTPPEPLAGRPGPGAPAEDRWILSRLNRLVSDVEGLLGGFDLGEAAGRIHDFIWADYCDWYIEIAKIRLRDPLGGQSLLPVLVGVLETTLRLLHPVMPFITEEIWQGLTGLLPGRRPDSVMVAPYPRPHMEAVDIGAEEEMEAVVEVVRSIRNARAQAGVEAGKFIEAAVLAGDRKPALSAHAETIARLARTRPLSIIGVGEDPPAWNGPKVIVLRGMEVLLPAEALVDLEAERRGLAAEMEVCRSQIARIERHLGEEAFLSKAPAAIIEKERRRLEEQKEKLEKLIERLSQVDQK